MTRENHRESAESLPQSNVPKSWVALKRQSGSPVWNTHKPFHLVLHTKMHHLTGQLSPDFNYSQMNPQAGGHCERSPYCVPRLEKKISVLMGKTQSWKKLCY